MRWVILLCVVWIILDVAAAAKFSKKCDVMCCRILMSVAIFPLCVSVSISLTVTRCPHLEHCSLALALVSVFV